MANMLLNALQRKLETAEAAGRDDKVKNLKARIAKEEKAAAAAPVEVAVTVEVTKEAAAPKKAPATKSKEK